MFVCSFLQRVKIFRNFIKQDKEALGIVDDDYDFSASCIFVKVRRNQLLEVCSIAVQDGGLKLQF